MAVPEKWLMTKDYPSPGMKDLQAQREVPTFTDEYLPSYSAVCAPVHSLASQFVAETRGIEQQQFNKTTLNDFGLDFMPIKTK